MFTKEFFKDNSLAGKIGFWVLILVGMIAFNMVALSMMKGWDSKSWSSTNGTIVSSKVKTITTRSTSTSTTPRKKRTRYFPEIHYKYQVDGKEYSGDRLAFGFSNRPKEESKNIVERYPAGAHVPVYYDPDNPEESVLEPGVYALNWLGIVFGIGAIGFAYLIRSADAKAQLRKKAGQSKN